MFGISRNRVFHFFVGLILSGGAFCLVFRNVPAIAIFQYVKGVNWLSLVVSSAILMLSLVVRAYRWRILLNHVKKVKFSSAYHPLIISFMLNNILPARIGEAFGPAVLKKNENISFTSGAATVVAERLFDIFSLVILYTILIFFLEIDPDVSFPIGGTMLEQGLLMDLFVKSAVIALMICLLIAVLGFKKINKKIMLVILDIPQRLPYISDNKKAWIQKSVCSRVLKLFEKLTIGFSFVKDRRSLSLCILCSAVIWGGTALAQFIIILGCPGVSISFIESFAVMLIVCVFIGLPSVPGFWGVWEAAGVFALSLFGVTGTNAIGFTLINHATQFFTVVIAGMISIFVYKRNFTWVGTIKKLTRKHERMSSE